jgi:hypothetical protein
VLHTKGRRLAYFADSQFRAWLHLRLLEEVTLRVLQVLVGLLGIEMQLSLRNSMGYIGRFNFEVAVLLVTKPA